MPSTPTHRGRAKEHLSKGMPKPTSHRKTLQPRQPRCCSTEAATFTLRDAFGDLFSPSRELSARPWTRAQTHSEVTEDRGSQKERRRDLLSVSIPTTASQDPVQIPQTGGSDYSYVSEDERSHKRRRHKFVARLTKENLDKLDSLSTGVNTSVDMNPTSDTGSPVATTPEAIRKRPSSRQTSTSDVIQDTASTHSHKSTVPISLYRYEILDRVRMCIAPLPPPDDIQVIMDEIFTREITTTRREEIVDVAKTVSRKFADVLLGAHREDDLLEPLYTAIESINKDGAFKILRKADWNPTLKPNMQDELWDMDALTSKRPSKRRSYPSPTASRSTMPPPNTPLQPQGGSGVRTPRPDFTVGFCHSTIVDALIIEGLDKSKADDFLIALQREQKLYSDPTQNFLNVRFPVLVIEGKAYATGKTVFEAQNQSAVSGSSMINLQQQLLDLFKGVFPRTRRVKRPLAFSICTEGPHIEFWVHYDSSDSNVRKHYMNILRTCYGSLPGSVEDFLMDVERLMMWARGDFLDGVAHQLFRLAKHAER